MARASTNKLKSWIGAINGLKEAVSPNILLLLPYYYHLVGIKLLACIQYPFRQNQHQQFNFETPG